ncbi:MAG: hypothetical protein AB8B99_07190 [Phormidesmis sp.]
MKQLYFSDFGAVKQANLKQANLKKANLKQASANRALATFAARKLAAYGAVAASALAIFSSPVSAQMVPGINGSFDPSLFSQDLTDAVTQGFRQRDRVFFEEGVVQFEHVINTLQGTEPAEPVLMIEPVSDDWQQFETVPNDGARG